MRLYLHVELAEDLGPVKDAEGDLVDAVVLHVEGVDGGELRGSAHRVRLEAIPGQGQTGQVNQARQEALWVRGHWSHITIQKLASKKHGYSVEVLYHSILKVWLI